MDRDEQGPCCFRTCNAQGPAELRLAISPPPDLPTVTAWVHEGCFSEARHPSVDYDDPKVHGRIPRKACCAFCGERLGIFGRHPYVIDVGDFTPPHRLWAHADCMLQRVTRELGEELRGRGHL